LKFSLGCPAEISVAYKLNIACVALSEITFKNVDVNRLLWWGEMGDSTRRKIKEQTLVRTIVVLIRNTTWRCGKVEKSIVRHLYKRNKIFGKPGESVRDIIQNLNFAGEKKDECIDALKRLEKRNIVKMLPL
jgi:hypothetical protein